MLALRLARTSRRLPRLDEEFLEVAYQRRIVASSAVTLSRDARRSSRVFRLVTSCAWFAISPARPKKRLLVSAARPKFFWFA